MSAITPESVPAISPEQVAAVVDRQVPVVLRHLDENPLAFQTGPFHLFSETVLLSQYGDRHSQYHGKTELLTRAWREIEHILGQPQPQFDAYHTSFELSALFDCYRAGEGVLSSSRLDQMRALFRPLGERLLDSPWDFKSDSRINVALLQAVALGLAGWALDDDRMRGESRARAEEILADHCDENGAPSELSISYYAHMTRYACQACEVEDRPELLRMIAGMCRVIPMLIYEPTLELAGPDCRELWTTPCRKAMDRLVLALKAAAVLLSDEHSEWLARTLFRKWVRDAQPNSAVYSPRAPRYLGVERYNLGYGAADSAKQIASMAIRTGESLAALRRWLGREVAAGKAATADEYRSSRLYLHRRWNGPDVAAVGNVIGTVSYATPSFALQGCELLADDRFFKGDDCVFHPTVFSDAGLAISQAPYSAALRAQMRIPASERIVRAAVRHGDQLLHVIRIDCSQELVPGIVSWAGFLMVDDREGEVVFGRGDHIARGRVLDEQENCDWILYPCGADRRFGFGIVQLASTAHSDRLINVKGDWCMLSLCRSSEPIRGLRAFAVLAIGPWAGSPESYAAWLRAWQVKASPEGCALVAPEGRKMKVPFPPLP